MKRSQDTDGELSVVVAGGGTAGHIEPAMAVADGFVAVCPLHGSQH